MAATTVLSFVGSNIKIRFGEPYVSDGLNAKHGGIIPRGIYAGYQLVASVAPLTAQLDPNDDGLHIAVYETSDGRQLTLRKSGGPIPVSLAAFAGDTVYVVLYATYSISSTTVAELRVYTQADYDAAPEKDELVVLGTVDVPGAGVIPDSDFSYAYTTYPWREASALIGRPWQQVVQNGSFEEGKGSVAAPAQTIPGFNGEESGTAVVLVDDALGRDGTLGLLMEITGVSAIALLGPGQFDNAKKLSGGAVPVQAGQLVDVSLWLSGSTVQNYSAGTSGFRCILKFYNLTDVLQDTFQVESDPAVHVGTFSYAQLAATFIAPSNGYFTWHLEASADLVVGVSQFFVDDVRIFLQPRTTPREDGDVPVAMPSASAMRADIVPDNLTSRLAQNAATARVTASVDGDSATVLSLTKAGLTAPNTEWPRIATPLIFKATDQSYAQDAPGVLGTESTADQDVAPHEYKIVHAYKASTADDRRIRIYIRGGSLVDAEYVITSNAYWGGGGNQKWLPDATAYDAVKLSVGTSGLRWESKDGILPSDWLDTAWDGTVGAGTGIAQLMFAASLVVDQDDATLPMLKTTKRSIDHPGFPANVFKVLGEFAVNPGANACKARIYSGGVGAFISLLCVTLNAEYDPTTSLWHADSTAMPAMRYMLVIESATTGIAMHVSSKLNTTVPWAESFLNWDTVQTPTLGSINTTDEFRWLGTRTKTVIIPAMMAMPCGNTALDWSIADGGQRHWVNNGASAILNYQIPVPNGAFLTRVRVLGESLAGSPWSLLLAKDEGYDFSSIPGTIVTTSLDSDTSPGVPGNFLVTLTCSEQMDKEDAQYYLRITSGANASDIIYAVEARFNESFVSSH